MSMKHRMTGFTLICSLAATACGGVNQVQLTNSSDIPAAQATAKVSTTDNGNTKIDLVVKHLAAPERVTPGATVYVVWVRASGFDAQPQNLGALRVDDNLSGNLSAVTPLKVFDLYITAELSQQTTSPMGRSLLRTTIAMKK